MSPRRLRSTPASQNAIDHRYWFASRNSHGNGDYDQNPERYRDGDSNRHSNSNTPPNSNSHSIGHIYSDGYRYASGSADRH
jgi:hypothetical protein